MHIKCLKNAGGYSFEFEDSRVELTHDGIGELIFELEKLESEPIDPIWG